MKNKVTLWFFLFLFLFLTLFFAGGKAISVLLLSLLIGTYTAKAGIKKTWFIVLVLFLLEYFFINRTNMSVFYSVFLLPALALGYFHNKRKMFSILLIGTSLMTTASFTINTLLLCRRMAVKPVELLFADTADRMQEFLFLNNFNSELFSVRNLMNTFQIMLPFFYIVSSIVVTYLFLIIVSYIMKKTEGTEYETPSFSELYIPKEISLLFLLLFCITLFTNSPILTNVMSIMYFLHFVCGIAHIDFLLLRLNVPRLFRILCIILIFFIAPMLGGIATFFIIYLGMSERNHILRK